MNSIENRLSKNLKSRNQNIKRLKNSFGTVECYRLYDKDIPEYPYLIDIYKDFAIFYEKGQHLDKVGEELRNKHQEEIKTALINLFPDFKEDHIIFKVREVMSGKKQYNRSDFTQHYFPVQEGPCTFLVNLHDFLDTGLFLDHRPLRQIIYKESKDKMVLNLFSYTSSIGINAFKGGAKKVVNVDMSKTYTHWSMENARINNNGVPPHQNQISFIEEDVLAYIEDLVTYKKEKKFDIIILDPPTFSNSKSMDQSFEVERDHQGIILNLMKILNPDGGVIYFSNNKRSFKLSPEILNHPNLQVTDISKKTIPFDFHDQKIHHCFSLKMK